MKELIKETRHNKKSDKKIKEKDDLSKEAKKMLSPQLVDVYDSDPVTTLLMGILEELKKVK